MHRMTRPILLAPLVLLLSACVVVPANRPPPTYHAPAQPPQPVAAVPMYFYPEQGQDEARQDRDRYECYRWAVRESGVDPGMTAVRQSTSLPGREPETVRNGAPVVAGAATGAILGAAASGRHHAGPAIVLGAIFGAAWGAAVQDQQVRVAERDQARRVAAEAEARRPLDNFRRAMSACMAGRNYRVG